MRASVNPEATAVDVDMGREPQQAGATPAEAMAFTLCSANYQVKVTRERDAAHVALLHGTVDVLDRPVAEASR